VVVQYRPKAEIASSIKRIFKSVELTGAAQLNFVVSGRPQALNLASGEVINLLITFE